MTRFKHFSFLAILFLMSIIACNTTETKNNSSVNVDTIKDYSEDRLDEAFDRAVIVFYALPSPIETARLFKRAGATFDETILNPTSNCETYISNKSLALNLGIYGADLSYSNLFDQSQIIINYFATSKKLAENLGILEAINDTTIEMLKSQITDRDFVMSVISDIFMNSQSYLKENNRPEVATMIVAGGWIEGLYIGTKLALDESKNQNHMVEAVADQNFSISDMLNLLSVYKDSPDIKSINNDFEAIKNLLSNVRDEEDKIDMIKFNELAEKVIQIRNSYIQ
ncbi:MAG: hypothetical protein KAI79_20505 [Bacteroidales bacterium]|nr:hypothetical protein [Bacteroidales bacterium]